MRKTIGIICAMEEEIYHIESNMRSKNYETISSKRYTIGQLNGKKCVACLSGIGKVNAAMACQSMILKYNPDFIINTGVAGAIGEKAKEKNIVIGENVIQHDFDVSAFKNRKKGEIPGINLIKIPCSQFLIEKAILSSQKIGISPQIGDVLTGDQFINSDEKLFNLKKEFDGIACEMEGASIGQVCFINDIPFIVVRSISDKSNSNSQNDFENNLKQSCEIAYKFLSALVSII